MADIQPRQDVEVKVTRADGPTTTFTARCRIDTYNELEYFRSGGILHYVLRRLAANAAVKRPVCVATCICGRARITLSRTPDYVGQCNCSMCVKTGFRGVYFASDELHDGG